MRPWRRMSTSSRKKPAAPPSRFAVVTSGEILWDIYEAGARRAGETIARDLHAELGGAPANCAVGLARLGVPVAFFGGVGADAFGESMRAALAEAGVSPELLVTRPERTGITFVRRDARGEPSFLFYRHHSADVSLQASDLPPSLGGASFLVVTSSAFTTPRLRNTTRALMRQARREGATVVVDLNVRAHLWSDERTMRLRVAELARHADLLKASDADLAAVTHEPSYWLRTHAERATWIVTRGHGPASAIGPHGEVELEPALTDVVDATGAGDAFLAGVLAVLVATKARPEAGPWQDAAVFRQALSFGHAMGQKAVSAVGAVAGLVELDHLRAELALLARDGAPGRAGDASRKRRS